jgi:Tol biopolymer transport system component
VVIFRKCVRLLVLAVVALAAASEPGGGETAARTTSHLLFVGNRDGDDDLYAIDPAGRKLAALTVNRVDDAGAVVSRDGRHLAFRRSERHNTYLYVSDGAGKNVRRVAEGVPLGWTPGASRLAFLPGGGRSGEPVRIAVVGADGTGVQLIPGAPDGAIVEFGGWSSDGRTLAYTRQSVDPATGDLDTELVVADPATIEHALDSVPGDALLAPAWSPTTRLLAYKRIDPVSRTSQLVVADPDAGTKRVVTAATGPPRWSPEGLRLLYSDSDVLKIVDLIHSGKITELARAPGLEVSERPVYAWSPDGLRVAFVDSRGLSVVGAGGRERTLVWPAPPPTSRAFEHVLWSPYSRALAFDDDGLRVVGIDGTGRRSLVSRGSVELVAWLPRPVPPEAQARRASPLPRIERVGRRLLASQGPIKELVASGSRAGVVSEKSRLACAHVLVWTPRARALARADRVVPCGPYPVLTIGGLDIHGNRLTWSADWSCGNTGCDHVDYAGVLRSPRRLRVRPSFVSVGYEGRPPKLPCVVCGRPAPTRRKPDVVPGRVATFVRGRTVIVRLLRTKTIHILRPPGFGQVLARLTPAGLFYGYSLGGGAYPGRVVFVPLGTL